MAIARLASRNGILINGIRIDATGCLLKDGLQLQIGQSIHNQIQLTYSHPIDTPMAIPSNRRLIFKGLKQSPIQLGRADKQQGLLADPKLFFLDEPIQTVDITEPAIFPISG